MDGDPARFQRYQDQRDGLLFSNFRYAFAKPDGTWDFHARADNVGYRDQEFMASYERTGKLSLTGSWQRDSAVLQRRYDDAVYGQRRHAGARRRDAARDPERDPAKLNLYVPLAPQFDLREHRDVGRVDMVATPKPNLDVTANFTTQKHGGELPWGASFGFSNDVEVPLPYESRTNDFTIGTEWTNARNMLRVAYSGSWFDNLAPTLTWDSPLRLDDASGGTGTRTHVPLAVELGPDHQLRRVHQAGAQDAGDRLLLLWVWSNDEPLQPFTINSALPQIALPRANTEGEAHVFSTNLSLTSRPSTDWRFSARVRNYTYDNLMPAHVDHGHGQLRLLGVDDANGRSGPLRAQPDELRRRRHVDETDAVRGHGRLLAQRERLRCADHRVERRERVPRVGRCRRILVAHLPRRNTSTAIAPVQGSTKRC